MSLINLPDVQPMVQLGLDQPPYYLLDAPDELIRQLQRTAYPFGDYKKMSVWNRLSAEEVANLHAWLARWGATPRRIQLSRAKGWRMPENTEKVDRSTYFGNPFRVITWKTLAGADARNGYGIEGMPAEFCASRHEAAALSVKLFREWLASKHPDAAKFRVAVGTLRGKNLACWCRLDAPCHADVLLQLASNLESA